MRAPRRVLPRAGVAFLLSALGSLPAQTDWVQLPLTLRMGTRGHAMAYDFRRDAILRHGGEDLLDYGTWRWTSAEGWVRIANTPTPPRTWPAMVHDVARDRMVLFGGIANTRRVLDGVWEWDGSQWQFINAVGPSPRWGHRMAYDLARGQILLFGGTDTFGNVLDDTWSWDGTAWTRLYPPSSPSPRWEHCMTYDIGRAEVVLFGGAENTRTLLDDTWAWDGSTWRLRRPSRAPSGRRSAALAYDIARGRCVLFGGASGFGALAETWEWDGSDWELRSTANQPDAAWGAAAAYHLGTRRTILWGGSTGFGALPWGTWSYGPVVPATTEEHGVGCPAQPAPLLGAGLPWLGTTNTFYLCSRTATTGPALLWLGLSDTLWRGRPLPLDLGAFGMPGCTGRVSADSLFFGALRSGCSSWSFLLPGNAAHLGLEFYAQGLSAAPGANQAGLLASNSLALVAGGL